MTKPDAVRVTIAETITTGWRKLNLTTSNRSPRFQFAFYPRQALLQGHDLRIFGRRLLVQELDLSRQGPQGLQGDFMQGIQIRFMRRPIRRLLIAPSRKISPAF